jgi:hypothetical protein
VTKGTQSPSDMSTREVGWGAIKAKLKGIGASELMTLVRDLYHASPENRQFLRGRLLHSPADLERYRRQVTDAVFPDPFSSKPVRVRLNGSSGTTGSRLATSRERST